jgi:hypothetical protein
MITISGFIYFVTWPLKCDHNKKLITLTLITLSGTVMDNYYDKLSMIYFGTRRNNDFVLCTANEKKLETLRLDNSGASWAN